ncbi:MAG: 3-deoxy-manno-octulosonate cytidylyltransferase [Acidobacteria bacterium]|nr:3-deoxy-manno-octulosonate cytidylyltransferase [Acidobacteriota bacterium]MBV9478604.1 3-deoxy-manno-octulosonate cytidylyltransferase [Acidobacteriota bacterium]
MRSVIVIPARWASTRFPGKPLAPIAGVSLIQRVYERAARSQRASAVYVATDDERILGHVAEFGGKVVRPEGDFQSGTDRIAASLPIIEAIEKAPFDLAINIQGDEPLIDVGTVDELIARFDNAVTGMATLACPLESDDEFHARDIVKVVVDDFGNAIYFSRAAIGSRETALRHIGVYAYRRSVLERFVALPPSPLERAESLEQLRAVQAGFKISVLRTAKPHLGVDRPEDVARVESELARLQA